MDLLERLKTELSIQGDSRDADLQATLDGARATFADSTARNLDVPADGDPDITVVRPIHAGIVRLPDARSITTVEVSTTRLNPTWVATAGMDAMTWFTDFTYVWMTVPNVGCEATVARITGKFGLHPLPRAAEEAIVALAALRSRSRGGEASGSWEMPDGQAEQTFRTLPPSYTAAVKALKVPLPPISSIQV